MGFGGGGDATTGQPYGYRGLPGLARGWIAGRRNDLSDNQWRTFRDNLPLLAAAAVATSALSRAVRRAARGARDAGKILIPFHVVYGAAFAFFLHGFGALWPACLCLAHYALCRAAAGWPKIGPILVWGFAIAALARVQFAPTSGRSRRSPTPRRRCCRAPRANASPRWTPPATGGYCRGGGSTTTSSRCA